MGVKEFCPVRLAVGLSVCLSAKNINIGHNFWKVSDGAFIFHVCILCGIPLPLLPRPRSSVIVKYHGHDFFNGRYGGISVLQTQLILCCCLLLLLLFKFGLNFDMP